MIPNLLPALLIKNPEAEEPERKLIPLVSPTLGFKPEYLFGGKGFPAKGWALGYEAGLQFGVGFDKNGQLHVVGLQNRFKDVYTVNDPSGTTDWKSWNLQLFYSFKGALSGGIGPGYSWSRRSEQEMGSRDGFHLNTDFRINPLFLASKKLIHWLTMEVQVLDVSIYPRFPTVSIGAGIFFKAWLPLG